MGYELEIVAKSQEIFYYLLQKRELKEQNAKELFQVYTEHEDIMDLVKQQGVLADSSIERYGDVIYLIPNENNNFLGYAKFDLKQALCRSGATDKDYYLSQFVILTLLAEFYAGQSSSSKVRSFIRTGELINSVADRLKQGIEKEKEKEEETSGLAFSNMSEAFEALRSSDNGKNSRAKTTKQGFMYTILIFLQKQGLIEYIEADEMIQTTQKLDHFMDWNLLNQNNYHRVMKILGVEENE